MPNTNKPTPQLLGLLLAGGKSSRFDGDDKGLHRLKGKPMAWHVIEQLKPQVNAMAISCNRNTDKYQQLFQNSGCKNAMTGPSACIGDSNALRFAGPLSGIYAFLSQLDCISRIQSSAEHDNKPSLYIAAVCCDMPAISTHFVDQLYRAIEKTEHKAAYFSTPSHAYYFPCLFEANAALEELLTMLQESSRHNRQFMSVKNLLLRLNAKAVTTKLQTENFININSKADIA